jgi:mRNA interferase RelE/StbE
MLVVWSPRANRDLDHLDPDVIERITRAIQRFAVDDVGDVIKLTRPDPEWRLRIGDWRVRFIYTRSDGNR